MAEVPSKGKIRRIVSALKKSKKKYVRLADLSRDLGLYPDALAESLLYFEPLIKLDDSLNLRDLLPQLESYAQPTPLSEEEKRKRLTPKKKEVEAYPSIGEFAYQKLTNVGGLVDKSITLSDLDLKILQKLVERELERRHPPKRAKKRKKAAKKAG